MSNFLDKDGLQRFFTGLKNIFAPKSHTHSASDISSSDTADQGKFLRADGTWQTVSGGGTVYELPTASATVKGGIKVGNGLAMSGETMNLHVSYAFQNLLWENASPTSKFAAQSVSIMDPSTPYDAFIVVSREFNTSGRHTAEIIYEGIAGAVHCWASTNNNRNGARNVTINTYYSGGVPEYIIAQFAECEYNGSTNNSYCIPYRIYGLRIEPDR